MFQIDLSWFRIDPWLIVVVAISTVAFLAFTIVYGIRAHRQQVSAGKEDLLGKTAEVMVALEPKGVVFIQGERWAAIADKGQIKPGEEVMITKINGLKLWVTKKE